MPGEYIRNTDGVWKCPDADADILEAANCPHQEPYLDKTGSFTEYTVVGTWEV